jgi:diguanylate cyclase (GGDEF)-like protein
MSEKYLIRSGVNAFLTSDESKWLEKHCPVRVGYQDNYMAFCAKDKETGELTGALKDYLEYASGSLQNAHIDFEPVAYPTVADAMEAMDKGEVDCVFPSNLSGYDGETNDIVMTPSLMRTDVFAVVRNSDARNFGEKNHVIVAVNEGNPNYDAFLLDNFPDWRTVYYPDTSKCLRAVADGVADCVLISSFRYNNIARECDKYNLTTIDTGVGVDYRFAVKSGNTELYSILARVIGLVPSSTINSVLSYYITEDAKSTFRDFFMDNMEIFTLVMLLLMAVVLALMFRSRRAERRANELISATEHDNLTGLYNRDFFLEYVNRMHNVNPNQAMDAVVCNIEQFHSVNAVSGRDFGDFVLRSLGSELKAIASERDGIAGRFGADRFDLYCRHTDDHQAIYDRLQSVLDEMAHTSNMRLRMGVMRSQPDIDAVQMFDMARIACNMIRGDFKEHLVVFDDEVREREEYEQRLLSDLQRALDSFEFEVYYQPKYDILVEPAKLVSAEALIRWRHPELGIIPPDDFIPLFERSGKISDVDKFVWNEAARQIVRWRELYGVTIPVSVNLSRVDVFDPALEETLDEIIKFNGLDHDLLKLEVTESAYTENSEQVIKVVSSLRRKGYVIEMDDFGTGYSSLSMLSEMPVDILKLDRNFVRNIDHSEKDAQLVALILDISKELDIPVVAEGVETEAQLQMLRKLGCAIAQGYYFSRPLNVAEFENKILKESIKEDK